MAGIADDAAPENCISPATIACTPVAPGACKISTSRFCSLKYPRSIATYQGRYEVERDGRCRRSVAGWGGAGVAAAPGVLCPADAGCAAPAGALADGAAGVQASAASTPSSPGPLRQDCLHLCDMVMSTSGAVLQSPAR